MVGCVAWREELGRYLVLRSERGAFYIHETEETEGILRLVFLLVTVVEAHHE